MGGRQNGAAALPPTQVFFVWCRSGRETPSLQQEAKGKKERSHEERKKPESKELGGGRRDSGVVRSLP